MKNIPLILLTTLLFIQCSAKKSAVETSNTVNDIWVLEELKDFEHKLDSVNKRPTLEIHLSDSSYLGNSSCNSYSGKLTLKNNGIKFHPALMTRMFCEGNHGLEGAYMKMLEKANTYHIEDLKLTLRYKETVLAVFKKID